MNFGYWNFSGYTLDINFYDFYKHWISELFCLQTLDIRTFLDILQTLDIETFLHTNIAYISDLSGHQNNFSGFGTLPKYTNFGHQNLYQFEIFVCCDAE